MFQYLLTRITAEEFAILPVMTSLMVFAPLFFSFFTGGISRYVVEAYAKGDFTQVTVIVSSIFFPIAIVGVIFFTFGIAFSLNIEKFLNIAPGMTSSAQIIGVLLVSSFTLQMLVAPFLTGFHVRQKFIELNLIDISRDILRISLLLVFLLGIGPQVVWVAVATAISEAAHSLVIFMRSRQLVPELRITPSQFSWHQAHELTSFGFWTTLGRLGVVMHINAATILLNLYGTAQDVTSYYLGATFFRQINSTVGLAALPLQPALTAMYALDDKSRLANTVLRGGRYALWVSLAVAVPLIIYSDSFIHLYLEGEYTQASTVIVLLMAVFVFISPTALLPMAAMATKQARAFFLPAFLFQLMGLLLMIAFVIGTKWGAVGVTLSLTISMILSQILYFWYFCLKLTDKPFLTFIQRTLVPGYLPALFGGVTWVALNIYHPIETWSELIAYSILGGIVYIAVLFTKCLDKSEREDLNKVFNYVKSVRKAN